MISVILAAGKGTRLQSVCACSSKCLLPINGITMLGRKVKLLAQSKYISKIIIVIRKEQKEIQEFIGQQCLDVPITYSYQADGAKGLVNALYSVEEIYQLHDTEVLLNLGDEYYENLDYDNLIETYRNNKFMISPVVIRTSDEKRIKANYTVKLDNDFNVEDVIEKPLKVFSKYIGCGTVAISSELLIAFSKKFHKQFEGVELVDLIKFSITNRLKCCAFEGYGEYVNLNSISDLVRIYQNGCNNTEDLIRSLCCIDSFDESTKNAVLLGRPNEFSRIYVLDSEKKMLGYRQTGDLWLWKKEFTGQNQLDKYQACDGIEKDILNSSEYMINLGIRGFVEVNGLYYSDRISDFIIDNKFFV